MSETRCVTLTAMKTDAATRWMRLRMACRLSSSSNGRAHHWSGIFQSEAGPDQGHERERQYRVLHPLERAACGARRERGWTTGARPRRNRERISLRIQSPPLCSSISPMVTGISSR